MKKLRRSHTTTIHTKQSKSKVVDEIVLRTVPVILKSGNKRLIVKTLLDDGSTKTYVNIDIAVELNLKETLERMNISVLDRRSESLETVPVEFGLESIDSKVGMKVYAFIPDCVTGNI